MPDEVTSTDPIATTRETTTAPVVGLEKGTTSESKTALGAGLEGIKSTESSTEQSKQSTGAPEKYEAWKLPENYELDAGVSEAGSKIFKELNLTQEQSQKLVDFYSEHAIKSASERDKFVQDFWKTTHDEWRETMKSDPVLGKLAGDDGNFGPNSPVVTTVNRALDGLQNPKLVSDFKDAMELTGAGNNPAFVRVLYALASKVTEGTTYARGEPSKVTRPTPGASLYPNLPSGG